jgi:exosortase
MAESRNTTIKPYQSYDRADNAERMHSYDALLQLLLLSVMAAIGVVLFHFQGNSTDVKTYGHSALYWLAKQWSDTGGAMSHGWIIPLVSIYFVWRQRASLAKAEKYVSYAGLLIVILSLLLHWTGIRIQQSRFALLSIIGLLWGIPLHLYGKHVAKLLLFPCAYLLFCIPWNFLDSITFPLRLFDSSFAAILLNGLGVETIRIGTMLHGTGPSAFHLDVADPCSGLRSLMAITALIAAYAQLTQTALLKKWVLFLSSIPIVMLSNIARIVIIALFHLGFGRDAASTLAHDYSGYLLFIVAVILVMGVGALLNIDFQHTRNEST